jgi:hypothetical protein
MLDVAPGFDEGVDPHLAPLVVDFPSRTQEIRCDSPQGGEKPAE